MRFVGRDGAGPRSAGSVPSALGRRTRRSARTSVVCQEGEAAPAGREVLRRGGNAVDAAIATAFALAVTHPAAGNIGGGGFIVAYLAESREVVTVDFREIAPQASTETMYLGPDGLPMPGHRAGPRAAGVPGTVRGLGLAHCEVGQDPLGRPRPARRRSWPATGSRSRRRSPARSTPSSSPAQARRRRRRPRGPRPPRRPARPTSPRRSPPSRSPTAPAGREGDLLIQRDLADTLDRIAEQGPDEFYTGETARKIVAHMEKLGGLVTLDDLAAYQAKARPPIHGTYKGFDVYGMGPPASGGILIVQMLNILERYDLKADGPRSPRTLHRVDRGDAPGFYTRATAIADPDFVEVPVDRLISKPYADELARSIGEKATPSASLAPFPIVGAEGTHTTHLSTLDAEGNAVALTYTLEEGYGSKSVVEGAGFLLNNEMGDFNLIPGRTDATGRIGTPAEPDRPRQADAQLAVADDRPEGRQGPARHRLAGRPDDPQHDALGRPQRPRIRPDPEGGGRRARGPTTPGSPTSSTSKATSWDAADPRGPGRDGPQAQGRRHPGGRPHDRGRPRRHHPRRPRPPPEDVEGGGGLNVARGSDGR